MTTQTQSDSRITKLKEKRTSTNVGLSLTQLALRRLRRDKLTIIALSVLIVLTILSFLAPFISNTLLHVSHTHTNVSNKFQPIGAEGHLLGTDDLGRDHLARLLYAGRISLGIAFSAAILSLSIGLSFGIVSGYHGGIIDDVFNWLITTLDSIPGLFLLLIISAVLSPGPATLILVLGFLGWTGTMRLIRGETFSLREREYVVSARAIGASNWRIMFTHIAPNVISISVVTLMVTIGNLILVESALSFLGLGVKAPTPTWGNMLTGAQTFFSIKSARHLVVMPGLLISITVLCLYIIGDGLRDAFDPTTRD